MSTSSCYCNLTQEKIIYLHNENLVPLLRGYKCLNPNIFVGFPSICGKSIAVHPYEQIDTFFYCNSIVNS